MPTLNPEQTLFTLSMLSNLGHCFTGTVADIEAALTPELKTQLSNLQPQIGSWELVWGPAVYELPTSDRPDNVMYVARGTEAGVPQLVVAVAATNPYSFLDWIVEDFLVRTQLPWLTGSPFSLERKISLGTFIGLSVLLQLKPGPGQPGAGTTLKDFLATQVSSPIGVNVSGHSLGGALSPTLALWLHDVQTQWDPAKHASLSALPSAGPTAGNQAFAAYSDAQAVQVTRVHNALDVVPHAWTTTDLQEVPGLYAPDIEPDALVNDFVALAIDISKNGGYTQIDLDAPALPGTVNTSIIDPNDLAFVNFFRQVGFQHVDAYYDLLGVQFLSGIMQCVKDSAQVSGPGDVLDRLKGKLAKFQA